jgi:hypothetical protein
MKQRSLMSSRAVTLAALIATLAGPACIRFHGPEDVRRELARSAGVKLDREMGFTVTRSGVWLARKIMKWSDETEEFSLKGVRRVEIGVYQVDGLRKGYAEPAGLHEIEFPDWTPVVKVQDEDEDVLVAVHENEGRIKGMLVVAMEDDEWVLVRVWGKLDRVIEEVMRMAFDEVDRPDLYERTRRARGLDSVDSPIDLTSLENGAAPACFAATEWIEKAPVCTDSAWMRERL